MAMTSGSPRFKIQSPFVQQVRSRVGGFGRVGRWLLLALAPLLLLRACVLTYVPPDQIGVRQVSFGSGQGLRKEPVKPGYRREIFSYEKVHTFPRDIQVVEFTNSTTE